MNNSYFSEALGRQHYEEMLRIVERDRLVRAAEREVDRAAGKPGPLWARLVTWVGGRMANATGAGEVPGL